ncbi:glutathione s-transferase [Plakobranchus ocellatus]|uniref:Glutathione s-transferase n=1 Tax=Plakobranchus ocellatus TaxID=259542 RepID=A0AAV3XX51_9GAST|nr:glutathione s-transferase [Plakobranchus ocellatus]
MAPKLKLVYFNIRGRGELIRLILHAGAITFTDERIPYEEWAQCKNQAPNGQVPYVEVDGKQYGEVLPIVRFVAKKCALQGKREDEQFYVEILLEQIHKFRDQLIRPKIDPLLNKGQKQYLEKKLQEEAIPKFLNRVEEALKLSRSGFILGGEVSTSLCLPLAHTDLCLSVPLPGQMTVADLSIWDTVDALCSQKPDIIAVFPKILEHRGRIRPPDQDMPKNPKTKPEQAGPPTGPPTGPPPAAPPTK